MDIENLILAIAFFFPNQGYHTKFVVNHNLGPRWIGEKKFQ